MAHETRRALLTLSLLLSLAGWAAAAGAYPCHNGKERMGDGVKCTRVALPKGLCSSCPLRPADKDGNFVKCWDIFDASPPACMAKMREYVAANPCDTQRSAAMKALAENPGDRQAMAVVDYFLYSVCEQCCDCVPMGSNKQLYAEYAKTHTPANPTLYSATRGNCPAHARYDICIIAPLITHFAQIGDPAVAGADALPAACPMLREWEKSPAGRGWQENPKTTLEPALNSFLNVMLDKLQCAQKDIWDRCYALEFAQDHLGVPQEVPEAPVKETPSASPAAAKPEPPKPSANGTAAGASATPGASPSASASPGSADSTVPAPEDVSSVEGDPTAPSPTASAARSGPPCFPAEATVELRGGARVSMADLRIGDEVRVAGGRFSRVYLFSHRDPSFRTTHLRVGTASGVALTLTPGHHLPVNGVHAPASSIVPGDRLDGVDGPLTVETVSSVARQGLYNPHTVAGTVVVDGVVCSTYTEAIRPPAAQALLAPLRALFQVGAVSESSAGEFLRYGADNLPVPLPVL